MTVDPEALRTVMRHWATGVAILGVRDGARAHGMTVSSFTSVSLTPPLILVCLERGVRSQVMVDSARAFALSFLGQDQAAVSNLFAGRETEQDDRWSGLALHTAVTGAPILAENLGYLDCVVSAAHPAGTHVIYLAEVAAARLQPGAHPLVYFDRSYRRLAEV